MIKRLKTKLRGFYDWLTEEDMNTFACKNLDYAGLAGLAWELAQRETKKNES